MVAQPKVLDMVIMVATVLMVLVVMVPVDMVLAPVVTAPVVMALVPVDLMVGTLVVLILEDLETSVALELDTAVPVLMATLQICQKMRCICAPQPITSTISIMPKL